MKTPKKVFITYSHENAAQRETLETALAVMIQNNEIEIWSDAQILPGDKWEREIKSGLEKSDILLYLVSPFSLASSNCNKELTDILSKTRNIKLIPIILEDCDFLQHPLAEFEALPTENENIKAISKWKPRSGGWQNVVNGIRETLASMPDISTQEEPTAESLFNIGNFFLMLNNYDVAISIYTEALKLNPTAKVYNNRGVAYDKKGDQESAFIDFNKTIELDPNSAEGYINRGIIYGNKGGYDKAITNYDKAIELNPKSAEAYNNRGKAHNNKDNYDKAITDLNKAIELNPYYTEAYSNRGNAYAKKGEFDKAIADHDKALELNPNDAKSHNNRGNAYAKKGEFDKAIADFDKAIELSPNYAKAYANRAIAKNELKDYKGTKEDLHTALNLAKQQRNKLLADHIQDIIANAAPN